MSFGQGGPYGPGGGQGPGGGYGPGGHGPGGQGPGGSQPRTPDWAALADDTARRDRRRKLLFIGGGVLATAAVAAIVATAVISSGDKGSANKSDKSASQLPSPQDLPSESPTPEPTFSDVAPPAPPKPLDIISSAKRDKAPISTGTLFPGEKAVGNGHEYTKAATATTKTCATAAQGGLGSVLTNNGCRQLFRATYSKDGVAVTVGIAVFDTKAAAERAKQQAGPNVASLSGGGVPVFCRRADCQASANAIGRYAYFTIAGYTSGANVTTTDTKAVGAGRDIADYAFRRILERGNQQASAAVTATD